MKFFLPAFISSICVLIAAVFYVTSEKPKKIDGTSEALSFSLAPFSLGNPIAAAMLKPHIFKKPFTEAPPPIVDTVLIKKIRVKPGETLGALLEKTGLNSKEAHLAVAALAKIFNPKKIRAGQNINLNFETTINTEIADDIENQFVGFSLEPSYKEIVTVSKDNTGNYVATLKKRPLTLIHTPAEGTITKSLYLSAVNSRVPNAIIAELIRIFSWDVDFQRDIQQGDSFQVMFEQLKDDQGNIVHNKTISFASLNLSGKTISIYGHQQEDGTWDYYNEAGMSTQKALMRTPIDGARLSSGFGARKHPILGYTMMHRGIDFAAPSGTPVYAAGDGVVSFASRKGAYGNLIKIRHNKTYSTAYAHLKKFAKRVRRGSRVKQGQVIGFVGTTGRSTGPHLHYEIFVNKKRTNPLRVRMPSGKKLHGSELKKFLLTKKTIDSRYHLLTKASNISAVN